MNQFPPPKDPTGAKKAFRNLFLVLLIGGILLGILLSIGVVKLLDQWGLTEPPQPTQTR